MDVFFGDNELHLAVRQPDIDLVRTLLNDGRDVNAKIKGLTPLHIACKAGKEHCKAEAHIKYKDTSRPMVELLLQRGADIDAKTDYLGTPLHVAIIYKNEEIVHLLLTRGADPNLCDIYSQRSLHFGALHGNIKIVELLLRFGADASLGDNLGDIAKDIAEQMGHKEIVEMFSLGKFTKRAKKS